MLLQTTVNDKMGREAQALARADGLRMAPWLRQLVAREVRAQRQWKARTKIARRKAPRR